MWFQKRHLGVKSCPTKNKNLFISRSIQSLAICIRWCTASSDHSSSTFKKEALDRETTGKKVKGSSDGWSSGIVPTSEHMPCRIHIAGVMAHTIYARSRERIHSSTSVNVQKKRQGVVADDGVCGGWLTGQISFGMGASYLIWRLPADSSLAGDEVPGQKWCVDESHPCQRRIALRFICSWLFIFQLMIELYI
jgi:hypothetical protein